MQRIGHRVLTLLPDEGSASLTGLVRASGYSAGQVKDAVERLSARGLAKHVGLARYRRTPRGASFIGAGEQLASGKKGPREKLRADRQGGKDTLRDRAWRALRQLQKATLPEILELAATGDEGDALVNIRHYFRILERYGVIAKLKKRVPGIAPTSNGFHRFMLASDLGPRSPIWRASRRELVDRNKSPFKAIPAPEARP